ncbi:MAG: HD domain-containing protein [Spirochaetales bacterium]|nr:HD domain-containing protein [Spirochaetales bacterium]
MERLLNTLQASGQRFLLQTYSALDRYYRKKNGQAYYFLTQAPLALLARLFDDVEYRGTSESDAIVTLPGGARAFFQCVDSLERPPARAFTVQRLYYDFDDDRYLDPSGVYSDLRARVLASRDPEPTTPELLRDAALLIARYDLDHSPDMFGPYPENRQLPVYEQKLLLLSLFASDSAEKGLALLRETGFIRVHWPEIEAMAAVPQTKDHHPEGHVFDHVLAAFGYRKKRDPALAFAIFLHDLGKTVAEGTKDQPYRDHAGRGAALASGFLRRLGMNPGFIDDVAWLIRFHMMPEALPRMPLYRIEKLLASPLFPTLLELYRADLLSTYRGPGKYYEACRLYQAYLKKSGNPFKPLSAGKPIT